MRPVDLGLPAKFESFRSYPGFDQFRVALSLATNPERFQILNAPTGSGKSLTYAAAASLIGGRWLALVGTKGLQNQLLSDFGSSGMRLMYGHRNYTCAQRVATSGDGDSVDDPEFQCGRPRGMCEYLGDLAAAAKAKCVVANYAYWMSLGRYSDGSALGNFDTLIMDEAHTSPDWLSNALAITLTPGRLRKVLGLSYAESQLPKYPEIGQWSDYAARLIKIGCERLSEMLELGGSAERRRLTRLLNELSLLSTVAEPTKMKSAGFREPWIVRPLDDTDGCQFVPRWGSDFAESLLFRGIDKAILCSATITKDTAGYLGIHPSDCRYTEVPSPFDPRRRPLVWIPTTRVDHRMTDGQRYLLSQRVDSIIEHAAASGAGNGVIHTQSYDRAMEISRNSRYQPLLITHRNSKELRDAVDRFKATSASGEFAVLVSPSVREGFDFGHNQCRWQIIIKVPFADSRDPLTKARLVNDKMYRYILVAQEMIQMVGRGVRSVDDYATTFILDNHWGDYVQWKAPFPGWFKAAFVTSEGGKVEILTEEKVRGLKAPPKILG